MVRNYKKTNENQLFNMYVLEWIFVHIYLWVCPDLTVCLKSKIILFDYKLVDNLVFGYMFIKITIIKVS